ncbi:response regulator [Parahaliea aestuarii]|uniref:Chemotaxis protein CheA n=1 Tax=Parahaliea aestuarii TaxID=1852021 RepID=A0A5C8ZXM5_9GAMM|nr:response regulator [Parahaliea aestuarii]TXS92342.1 response regulator [Parahaliea aestuarii]
MYSDNSGKDEASTPEQEQRKKTLKWLLEQDLSEQGDSLFRLADDAFPVGDLSESETAVAGRHMMGGNGAGDDLSAFVDEEIVLSEDSGSDIYADSRKGRDNTGHNGAGPGVMAIDHRRRQQASGDDREQVADGSDILGLLDDDDIGAQPLFLQRHSRPSTPVPPAPVLPPEPEPEPAEVVEIAELAGEAATTLAGEENSAVEMDAVEVESSAAPVSADEQTDEGAAADNLADGQSVWDALEAGERLDVDSGASDSSPDTDSPTDYSTFFSAMEDAEALAGAPAAAPESADGDIDFLDGELDLSELAARMDSFSGDEALESEELPLGFDSSDWQDTDPLSGTVVPAVGDSITAESETLGDAWHIAESGEHEAPDGTAAEPEEEQPGDVYSYVSRYAPPSDDSEFDRYLLQGGSLADSNCDIDGLEVERTEGVVSVDPWLDSNLDYHQDFSLPQDFNPATVAVLTQVLAPVMESVSGAVARRLAELGQAEESVLLDAMLATDPLSRRQSVAEGYLPVAEVCPELPAALLGLQPEERDALCLRLAWCASGDTCNRLLHADFELPLPSQQDDSAGADNPWSSLAGDDHHITFDLHAGGAGMASNFATDSESANDGDSPGVTETSADEGDEGEVVRALGAEFPPGPDDMELDNLLLGELSPEAEEFDPAEDWPAFAGELKSTVDESSAEELAADELSAGALSANTSSADDLIESLEVDTPDGEESPAFAAVLEDALAPMATDGEQDGPAPAIFSAADLDDWDDEHTDTGDADVEALFDSLGGMETEIDDIYGAVLEELSSDEDIEARDSDAAPPVAAVASGDSTPAPVSPEAVDDEMAWCIPSNIRFNYTSRSGTEVFRDFLDAFLEEGAVEIEKLEDAIGQWEQDINSAAGRDTVPRVLHTLKGIAKGVGLQRYGTLIHNFETLLEGLARPAPGSEAAYFRIVNAWLDAAVNGFAHIQDTETDVASELPLAEAVVQPLQQDDAAAAVDDNSAVHRNAVTQAAPQEKQQDKQLADEGAKVLAAQQTIRMTSQALDHLLNLNNQAQQLGVRASQSTVRGKRAAAELGARLSSVRSHITKIADRALQNVTSHGARMDSEMDALEMDRYSELQEAASILREAIEDLDDLIHVSSRQAASAEALLKQQTAVISSLGSSIRDARVVPVSRLMPGLRRIVRTVGADLGKSVNFRVLNEMGKLDRDSHVCCQIILEHMVRNALDHGIETPEQRLAAGKSETGLVSIDVRKHGSDYLIRLADDGRGMDPEVLRETAITRGLGVNASELSDREALRLIFHKGFSTAARLSEISGRGVGMDIVLSELQQIGGDIDIESIPGQGTTFTVRVPSNVNVNGALLVNAGEAAYAIPLDGLVAVEQIPVDTFYAAIAAGEKLSLFELDCEPAYLATLCNGDKLPEPGAWNGSTVPVIVAGSEERYMAIAVDDVQEALELVIRSLGVQFAQVPGVAGGATTSDGQAIVALDLNALVRSIASSVVSSTAFEREKNERMLVLVVDDSRTQRMVATSQFDSIGVETVTAENGMVAIDLLNTTHRLPDIVLLDVEMPVKDGIQTLREIRKSARYKHLPVIMVTSRTGPKHRALAQEAGCNGYMGKPFNFPVLVEQIAQLTGHRLQLN